ncbi:MAG: 50S ribosomal protein L24 [bacterium]|nr:50S ribosomal protein L24 [bacterium]
MAKFSLNLKKNDLVSVITGKDKGKQGKVLTIQKDKSRLTVERINQKKKHSRPTAKNRQGGIVEFEAPMNISNVMLVCPSCNATTRVAKKFLEDGKKVRICKKCQEIIDK